MGMPAIGFSDDRKPVPGDPVPERFYVVSLIQVGTAAVVELRYPDCRNYEGRKVLVFDDYEKFVRLRKTGAIDPHFLEDVYSPVARFEPTERGRKLAGGVAIELGGMYPVIVWRGGV